MDKRRFRLAVGSLVIGLGLTLVLLGFAQSGPDFEAPPIVMSALLLVPVIALLLAIVGLTLGLRSGLLSGVPAAARLGFWTLVGLTVPLPILTLFIEPEQWVVTHPGLSTLAVILALSAFVVLPIVFWWVAIRAVRQP